MSEPTDIGNDDDEAFAEETLTQAIENQIESGAVSYTHLTLPTTPYV